MIRPQKQFSPQLHRAEPAGGCVPALALRWEAGGAPPKCSLTLTGSISRGAFQERVVGFCEEAPGSGWNEGRRAALSILADNTSMFVLGDIKGNVCLRAAESATGWVQVQCSFFSF